MPGKPNCFVRAAIVSAALVLIVAATDARGQDVPPHVVDMCRERATVTAQLLHGLWEQDGVDAEWPATTHFHIGSGMMALLIAIRTDEHMAGMTEDEFIDVALRICEPVYHSYFKQRMR